MNAAAGRPRLHPAILATAGLVAAAAFAFSADSWVQLAEIAGFHTSWRLGEKTVYLSWLMPLAFDAYTGLATWTYFTARGTGLREYAKRTALGTAGLSVIVQGAYHGLKANNVDVAANWGLVVAVGAIPALLLGAVTHLVAEYIADRAQPTPAPPQVPAAPPAPVRVEQVPTPRARWVDTAGRTPLPIAPKVSRTPPQATRLATPTIGELATLATTIPAPPTRVANGTGWPPLDTPVNGHRLTPLTRTDPQGSNPVSNRGSNRPAAAKGSSRKPAGQQGVKESKTDRQKRVSDLLAIEPDAGAKRVANQLDIPVSTARNDLAELRAAKES